MAATSTDGVPASIPVAHLLLELGQLARQVADQFHGRLQLLLQVADLILLTLAITAHQRHGAHPREPVQVVLLWT